MSIDPGKCPDCEAKFLICDCKYESHTARDIQYIKQMLYHHRYTKHQGPNQPTNHHDTVADSEAATCLIVKHKWSWDYRMDARKHLERLKSIYAVSGGA